MDVTDEVIRDYHLPPSCSLGDHERESEGDESFDVEVLSPQSQTQTASTAAAPVLPAPSPHQDGDVHGLSFLTMNHKPSPSSSSQVVTENAVANLIYFSQGRSADSVTDVAPLPLEPLPMDPLLHASNTTANSNPFNPFDFGDHIFSPDGSLDDGIFLPGSSYYELHSTLRNHLIQEVKSNGPTRPCSPAGAMPENDLATGTNALPSRFPSPDPAVRTPRELSSDREPPQLSGEDECALWKNWFEEISPWVDKFDNERHFQHVLPGMARSHDHLRYSMLALSARQRELKSASRATDLSLSLYQEAIHLLLPQLSTRSTPVIASCIVLCVLEMCSCSPKAWRRHLDGCASLMSAVGMNGFAGGLEQALFWCFARMDVCGGLISSVKTLIPTGHWASRVDMAADAALFHRAVTGSFAMWANYAIYLCAQVLDLLAPLAQANPGGLFFEGPRLDADYRAEWLALWRLVDEWHAARPPEMCHVFALASNPSNPFPSVIYSNSAAISGNQMYHTAALLMLQNKPASLRLGPRPKSALWHARQICAISMSNHHHGAWTNSIQPLWIAGRCMSHPAEHKAILDLYAKIERESGWSTKWRADDLQDFWGDLAEDGE
jgi:hypothetical protein